MENSKWLTFDDTGTAASALRRLTRSPTGQRLGLRRSSTSSSSAISSVSSVSSLDEDQTPLSCASRNASGDDCALYKFIVWAAVKRNACHKMTEEQRRECPLLYCRKRFPNHELMLRHLYTCEHLSGGEYWCFDCGKAERLNDSKCRRCLGHPSKRRKLMSMAKKVFGSLGNRPKTNSSLPTIPSSLTVDEQPPSYDSVFTPVFAELSSSNEIHEIDSTEISLPTIPECEPEPTPAVFLLQPDFQQMHQAQIKADTDPRGIEADFIDWEPLPSPPTVAPQNLLRPALARPSSDKPALQLHTHGLEHYRPPVKRRSKTLAPSSSIRSTSSVESADSSSSNESYDISPMSGWSGGWTKDAGFASVLTSPCDDLVSPEESLPADDGFAGPLKPVEFSGPELSNLVANSFLSELPAEVPGMGVYSRELILPDTMNLEQPEFSFEATVPLQIAVDGIDVPQMLPPPPPELLSGDMGNARSLVRAAEETLRVHIAESVAKLGDLDSNAIANEFRALSPAAVAHAGLETLADILEGRQATSSTNLLCFIHLIYSLSLLVHEQDIETRYGGLFTQALLYSSLFSDHERPWYIEAVYSLWKPSQVSDRDVIDVLSGVASSCKGKAPERVMEGQQGSDSLVFVAQYFLDELEYLALREVEHLDIRASALCMHHIKDLLHMDHDSPSPFSIAAKFLIERGFSTQFYGVPDFLPSVQTIIEHVKSGRISTVRQLELELMQAGKLHLPAETFFDRYVEHVRQQVDLLYAVHGSTFSSRSTYHSCGVQLMRLLMSSTESGRPGHNEIQDEQVPGPIDGLMGSIPKDLEFDLNNVMSFGLVSDPTTTILPPPPPPHAAGEWQSVHASAVDVMDVSGSLIDSGAGADSLAASTLGAGSASAQPLSPSSLPSSSSPPPPPPLTAQFNEAADDKPTHSPPPPATAEVPASIKVESNSCCEICGYRPKGDPRWFGGSMAKHKKLQHSQETKIYRCPYPGCTSQYSRRPDNLRQHQIEKGHFVDGQGQARKRSRKREWATEAE